jgi:hypothetical protein
MATELIDPIKLREGRIASYTEFFVSRLTAAALRYRL